MAVAIRLSRQGSKKRPFYRVVAADKRSPRDGRFIELLGIYDPRAKVIRIDQERYEHWVSHGAQPSPTVASLAKKAAKAEGGYVVGAPKKSAKVEEAAKKAAKAAEAAKKAEEAAAKKAGERRTRGSPRRRRCRWQGRGTGLSESWQLISVS